MAIIADVSWDQFVDGHFPQSENPTRQIFRAAVEEVAHKAREVFPEANGRIDKAIQLVLAGDVELLENGTKARVASQSNGTTAYHIVNGSCDCRDFEKAPENFCKHRLAYGIYKRAYSLAKQRLEAQEKATSAEPELVASVEAAEGITPNIPAQFLTTIHGKEFVQYAGLLAMAHERGLVSLSAHFISVTETLALAEAEATFADGKTYSECADSTPQNVGPTVKAHFPRIALTRAKARCLRDALNISVCSVEEMET